MRHPVLPRPRLVLLAVLGLLVPAALAYALAFDQDATPDYFAGTGIANGGFTVARSHGVELALRPRVRFNASCLPENTFNSNGDGTYSFDPVARDVCAAWTDSNTPEWSFDWSVNTDWDDSTGTKLDGLTYELSLDADPSPGVNALVFDPINVPVADHAIGDNTSSDGNNEFVAANAAQYAALIAAYNVAQNSWNYEFFDDGAPLSFFDPTVDGVYDISLTAFHGKKKVASTTIQVLVGNPLYDAGQCKKGGWADFGFKNQGQCVRYVKTGKDSR